MAKITSATGTPQPDHPTAVGNPSEEISAALSGEASRQEKLDQDLLQSDQAIQGSGQAIQDSGQEIQDSGQEIKDSSLKIQDSDQAILGSEQAIQDSDQAIQDSKQAIQDSEQAIQDSGQAILDYGHALPEHGQELLEASQHLRVAGQHLRETDQGLRISDQFLRTSDQSLRASDQDLRTSDRALRSSNRALAESEERFRLLVESVTDYAIYMLDPEGRVVTWNAGAERLKGYTAEEVLGQDYSIFFLLGDVEAGTPARELAAAAREGRYETQAWRRRKEGSKFWALITLTAIRGPEDMLLGFAKVTRDMTAQKQMAEQLAQLAAGLENRVAERTRELEVAVAELQRKNKEIESFVYIVTHDLRAPLVNVQGFAHELEESCKHLKEVIRVCPNWERCWPDVQPILDEEIGSALRYISTSTSKFERLINALLSLSRHGRQVYDLTRVNVWELVTTAVTTFQMALTEAGAEVEVGTLPSVTADATALGQVFSNLIGNALKYRNPMRPLHIEVGGQVEGDVVHYWVRDNGLGIPEYGKAKLFQVFQRFHAQHAEGEGMGLAIAHRIVERHGGKIWAESREGEGTTFHFSLPAHPSSTPNAD